MNEKLHDQLVTQSLASRLTEAQLQMAYAEASYTLALTELKAFKAVLDYDPTLKELFEEVKGKMADGNQ